MNTPLSLLAELTLKSSLILTLAAFVVFCFRRHSAARRHAIWFSALAVLLLLPALAILTPGLSVVPRTDFVETFADPSTPKPSPVVTPDETPGREARASIEAPDFREASGADVVNPAPDNAVLPITTSHDRRAVSDTAAARELLSWRHLWQVLPWIWGGGFLIVLSPLVFGYIGVRRIARSFLPCREGREWEMMVTLKQLLGIRSRIRLLKGPRGSMPMTWGIGLRRSASVLLPAEAGEWSHDRLRSVLLHELAHVRRGDCLAQFIARLACAAYWFNPLVWFATARMKVERERACDDMVLCHSDSPSSYARDLIEVATHADTRSATSRAAIAMARPHKLDLRLRAIMDSRRNRSAVGKRAAACLMLLMGVIALPVSSLQWAAASPEPLDVSSVGQSEALDFRVIDQSSGTPLTGVDVKVRAGPKEMTLVTDASGRCLIERPESEFESLFIQVAAEGYVPMRVLWRAEPRREPIPEGYTLKLERGTWIGGHVVDDLGDPVEGATVMLDVHRAGRNSNAEADLHYVSVETGADGHWQYPAAPREWEEIRFGVYHPDYAAHNPGSGSYAMRKFESASALRDGTATHVLERGERLPIRIVDAEGKPAAGATIGIGRDRFGSNMSPERTADAAGEFLFPLHPNEDVVLTIKYPGHAPELIRIDADDRPEELRVQLSPGHRLEGQVVDSEGRPIAGAGVAVDTWRDARSLSERMLTDGDGRFAWNGAPGDSMQIDVFAHGYSSRRRMTVEAGDEIRIVLSRPSVVHGRVIDATTGDPIQKFSVTQGIGADSDLPARWQNRDRVEYDASDGRFEMTFTYPRRGYAVRVEADGYLPADSPSFSIPGSDQFFTFELQPASALTGRVVDSAGLPVAGAEVAVATAGRNVRVSNGTFDEHFPRTLTNDEGIFTIPPQGGPFFVVVIHDSGYAEIPDILFFESAGEIILQPWARIEGQLWVQGHPAEGERLSGGRDNVLLEEGNLLIRADYLSTFTDAEGFFTLERVPPGEVELGTYEVMNDQGVVRPVSIRRMLQPGETLQVVIGKTGRPVVGRYVLEAAKTSGKVAGAALTRQVAIPEPPDLEHGFSSDDLYLWDPAWMATAEGKEFARNRKAALAKTRTYRVDLDADGSFRFEDVEPGDYTLEASVYQWRMSRVVSEAFDPTASVSFDITVPAADGAYDERVLELPVLELSESPE